MENKKEIIQFIKSLEVLQDSMKLIYNSTTENVWKYGSYKEFMRKYNEIAQKSLKYIEDKDNLTFDVYILDNIPSSMNTIALQQQNLFDSVYANVGILKVTLESLIEYNENEIMILSNFIKEKLRPAVINQPDNEKDIQNVIEQIFIGSGKEKGIDYGREVGRVKISSKEVIPDFVFYKLDLAVEVKFCNSDSKVKSVISQIADDIHSYSQNYKNILFIIYDMGYIKDELEFKQGLDNNKNITVIIVKN